MAYCGEFSFTPWVFGDCQEIILYHIQWCSYQNHQSPIYDMKWGHFDRVNSTFKMLLSSWNFDTVFKKIRSFDAKNLNSVDLRAAKLLAVKVGDLKKSLLPDPGPTRTSRVCAESNHSQNLMAGNFLKTVSKFQENSSILKVEFTLSKWSHFIS